MPKKHLNYKKHHFEVVSSNSTTTSEANSTISSDNTNSTTTNSTTNSTDTSSTTSSSSDDSSDTGLIVGLVFGVLIFILLVVLGVWFYLKWKQKKIIKDYTMNPESFLAPQKLTFAQNLKLRKWDLSKDPKFQITDFSSKTVSTILGSYLQLNFKQEKGVFQSVIGDSPIDVGKENSYFEIEIDNLPSMETLVVIGFAVDADYVKTFCPGTYPNSIGFQSCNDKCDVMMNNKSLITFGFTAKFGETLGLGIRGKDKRVWLSYNGKFLNPPPPSEKVLTEKELKKKEADFQRMDPDLAKQKKEEEIAMEKEFAKKKITFQGGGGKKKFFPVIGCNGPCVLNLNVGGMPFRLFQKEIASGLL